MNKPAVTTGPSRLNRKSVNAAEAQNRSADRVRERETLLDPSLEPDLEEIAERHAGVTEAGQF